MIEWDDNKSLVWIVSALDPRYFKPNPNILKSVINDVVAHSPHKFVAAIVDRYGGIYPDITQALERVPNGSAPVPK